MGFGLIFAGLVFFSNPCVNLFDILPDFIGCILISAGLYKLADVEERFFSARQVANRMIVIYIVKTILWVVVAGSWKSGALPFTFIFSVIEIIMMLGLCATLYGAIEYTANLHGGDKHLANVGTVTKYTLIFMVVKNVLAFLPEAFELTRPSEYDFSYETEPVQSLAEYKPYAILFFSLIILVMGIYYVVTNARFFINLAKDKQFNSTLRSIYDVNVTNNVKILAKRRYKKFFILGYIASLLSVDMIVDSVNLTSDIFSYLVLVAAVICLAQKAKAFYLLSVPLILVTGASEFFRYKCESGINRIMDYKTYNVDRVLSVENGTAIFTGLTLIILQMVLFVTVVAVAMRVAAKYFGKITNTSLSTAFPVCCAGVLGIFSVISYVSPILKAHYRYRYINNTLTGGYFEKLSAGWETAQGISNVMIVISSVLLLYSVYHTSQKVNYMI